MMPSWFWVRLGSITDQSQDESGSRQARKDLMWEGWQTFVDHPLTGVGAGQFKNYNPPDRLRTLARDPQRAAAGRRAELGIFGLLVFFLLLWQAGSALLWTRRHVRRRARRALDRRHESRSAAGDRGVPRPTSASGCACTRWRCPPASSGWLVCAQFASVGYYWTFYYLFALIVAGRELTSDRVVAASQGHAARAAARLAGVGAAHEPSATCVEARRARRARSTSPDAARGIAAPSSSTAARR